MAVRGADLEQYLGRARPDATEISVHRGVGWCTEEESAPIMMRARANLT